MREREHGREDSFSFSCSSSCIWSLTFTVKFQFLALSTDAMLDSKDAIELRGGSIKSSGREGCHEREEDEDVHDRLPRYYWIHQLRPVQFLKCTYRNPTFLRANSNLQAQSKFINCRDREAFLLLEKSSADASYFTVPSLRAPKYIIDVIVRPQAERSALQAYHRCLM